MDCFIKNSIYCSLMQEAKYILKLRFKKFLKKFLPQNFCQLNIIFIKNVLSGYKTYKDLLYKYNLNCKIKVLYTGTGDAYIAATYYKNYISSLGEKDCALLVVGSNSVKNLVLLFGIEDVHVLTQRQILELIKLYVFLGEKIHIEILHPHLFFRHTGFMAYMEGIHPGMDFAYMMRHVVFENVLQNTPTTPEFKMDMEYIVKLQNDKRIKKNNTVLLIPYSTTIKPLPSEFWEKLIESLERHKFLVFVNAEGKKLGQNHVVKNLFLPYEYTVPVLDYFQFFVVGMRCGFFDVINTSRCHMIALYNSNEKRGCAQTANLLTSFSIASMYGNSKANEYLVDDRNIMQIVERIVNQLCIWREANKTAEGESII